MYYAIIGSFIGGCAAIIFTYWVFDTWTGHMLTDHLMGR